MDSKKIESEIKFIISDKLGIDEEKLKPGTSFAEIDADSLDVADLFLEIEKKYGIEIDDKEVENLKTIDEIIKYIIETINKNN